MLELAEDILKLLQDRFRHTLRTVADLAESVGIPPAVTSLLAGSGRAERADADEWSGTRAARTRPVDDLEPGNGEGRIPAPAADLPPTPAEGAEAEKKKPVGKRRGLVGAVDLSHEVRPLEVDDEIDGSTYLARIIWCLGVAELEGTGPLRPADMARMIMSRSAVSLEPPNVARYIRRSKPTSINVTRTEGSSSFYGLNEEGWSIFDRLFRLRQAEK